MYYENGNKMKCKVCGYTHVKGFTHNEMGSKEHYVGFLKHIPLKKH